MSYCEVADVVHELHPTLLQQMRVHYNGANTLDFDANIELHIQKAQALTDATLARAYSVPLRQATKIVTSAVCKIAAYFAAAAFAEQEEVLKDKYETGMLMLDALLKADRPELVDSELDDGQINSHFRWGSDKRIFTPQELAKW